MRPAVFDHLRQFGRLMSAPRQSVVLSVGERSEGAYLLISGRIPLSILDGDGVPLWSRMVEDSAILGLPFAIANERHSLKAVAVEPTELAFIEREKLRKLLRGNPALGSEIVQMLSAEVAELHYTWSALAKKSLNRHRKA